MVVEEDVGIACYVSERLHASSNPTFTGVLRHRYSDFRVNEVGLDNREARLTTQELPCPKYTPPEEATHASVESVLQAYQGLYPEQDTSNLRAFLERLEKSGNCAGNGAVGNGEVSTTPEHVELKVCEDKEKRTQVHAIFRNVNFLPVSLKTTMAAGADEKCPVIVVSAAKGRDARENNTRQRRHAPWSGGKTHKYVKFVMEKTNVDHQTALDAISGMIRPRRTFGTAGTKDKRAVTTQFVTVQGAEPFRLKGMTKGLSRMNIRVGNFEYATEQLGLGDLSGNKFEIVLRGVQGDGGHGQVLEDVVREAVAQTREHGFLNYFGLQRFGTGETPTHVTGELLLRGKWKDALDCILRPSQSTSDHVRKALDDFLEDRDATKALKVLSNARQFPMARKMLEYLERHGPTDYCGALEALPKNMRALYVGAYNGFVWNHVVSERVRTYGVDTVLPGDLVIRRGEVKKESGLSKRKREAEQRDGESAKNGRMGDPHVVTEEDIKEGRYVIDDVVLPIPGWAIKYPQNATAAMYAKYTTDLTGKHRSKPFMVESYPGDYRHILYRPKDLECKLYRYTSVDEELPAFDTLESTGTNGSLDASDGLAVLLRFFLPSSTYATMCIREITRMPTHVGFAVSLGKQ